MTRALSKVPPFQELEANRPQETARAKDPVIEIVFASSFGGTAPQLTDFTCRKPLISEQEARHSGLNRNRESIPIGRGLLCLALVNS